MQSLTLNRYCVCTKNDVEIWITEQQYLALCEILENKKDSPFIRIGKTLIERHNFGGIFTAQDMDGKKRRKNGQWQCMAMAWHDKWTPCSCVGDDLNQKIANQKQAVDKCGKCTGGYIVSENDMKICECLIGLI